MNKTSEWDKICLTAPLDIIIEDNNHYSKNRVMMVWNQSAGRPDVDSSVTVCIDQLVALM